MRQREGFHWFRRWRPSAQQARVLDALLEDKTNAQIAGDLGISQDGAKWHISQLLGETGLDDRYELADWWRAERERVEVRRGLWPLAGLLARAALIAPVILLAVWLVISDPLSIGGGAQTQASAPAPGAAAPTAIPPPPPSPTPDTPGGWIIDLRDGSVRTMARINCCLQWLGDNLFLAPGMIVDADGAPVRGIPATQTRAYADQSHNKVITVDFASGTVTQFDPASGDSQQAAELGRFTPDTRGQSARAIDVSAAAGLIAVADMGAAGVKLDTLGLDGSGRRTIWSAPAGVGVNSVSWSPDGKSLLLLTTNLRLEGSRYQMSPAETIVLDPAGRVLQRRDTNCYFAEWLGPRAVLADSGGSGTCGHGAIALNLSGGEEPGPALEGLLCVSPDGLFGVYGEYSPAPSAPRGSTQRVVELSSGNLVIEAKTRAEIGACDWTSDSTRVVLSFGGK